MNILDKTRLLQTSILSSLIMGLGGAAYAQDNTVEQVPASAEEEFEESNDTIVVTGSRIRRPEVDSVFPTTVVDTEALGRSAFTNIADALTEIPAFGGGIDPIGDQGANIGANFVDFLNLGTQRTLTLVNGRRFVSGNVGGNGLQVDFNVIPLALVDRIDTVSIGGAPIYGSDAIAGAINVILKDDFEGLEATATFGQTERGDGDRRNYQIVAGANSSDGRGNVTFAAEYFNQDGLLQTDRPDFFVDEPFLSEVPDGTAGFFAFGDLDGDGDEDGVFRRFNIGGGNGQNVQLFTNGGVVGTPFGGIGLILDDSIQDGAPGINDLRRLFLPAQGLGGLQFLPNGDLVPFEAGAPIPGTSAFFAQGGTQNDFFGAVDQIQSPLERINFSSTFKYDINSLITFKGDVQIANTKSEELVDQGGFQTFAFDGDSNNDIGGAIQLPVSNPFLTPQNRQALTDAGFGPDDSFFFSRFNNDLLDGARRESESNIWRIAAGLEGEFEAFGGRNFNWDAYAVAGQTTNETTSASLLNDTRFLNAIEAVRLTQSDVDAISAAGNNPIGAAGDIVCQVTRDLAAIPALQRTLDNPNFTGIRGIVSGSGVANLGAEDVTGCAPLNLFGEGNGSPEALEFISQQGVFSNDIEQRIFNFNFGGELFELPAGWVQFAVGYETRRENFSSQPSGDIEVGLGRGAAVPRTGGSFSTDEFNGEILVPLVSPDMEIPFVNRLEAEAQIREISNTASGDATVWTVAGRYAPIEDIAFRGNITRSVRAPSLQELFQPVVTSFQFADDPCDDRFIGDDLDDQDGVREANCATLNLPPNNPAGGFTSNIVNATAQGTTGGNPNLFNEEAEGFSIGAVIEPRFAPGLTITADYINLDLNNLISALTVEQNLQACFDDPTSFPNAACSTFSRDATGQVVDFTSGQTNADLSENEFLTLGVDYTFDVADAFNLFGANNTGDLGSFSIRNDVFHIIKRDLVLAGVPNPNIIGSRADPRWEGTTDLIYNNGGFSAFWRTFWTDRILFSPSGNNFFADENDELIDSVGGRFLHNASVSYDVSEIIDNYDKPLVLQLNVDNVFNQELGRGNDRSFGNNTTANILGRRFTLRVRAAF